MLAKCDFWASKRSRNLVMVRSLHNTMFDTGKSDGWIAFELSGAWHRLYPRPSLGHEQLHHRLKPLIVVDAPDLHHHDLRRCVGLRGQRRAALGAIATRNPHTAGAYVLEHGSFSFDFECRPWDDDNSRESASRLRPAPVAMAQRRKHRLSRDPVMHGSAHAAPRHPIWHFGKIDVQFCSFLVCRTIEGGVCSRLVKILAALSHRMLLLVEA
jgi:hypothetical protein